MASSSSSSSGAALDAVWLYDQNLNRIALVDVPVPLPNLITYLGVSYVWSNVHWCYQTATSYAATLDNGQPLISVLANPQQ